MLVDAGFVGERIAADDGLVGLGKDSRHVREQLAGAEQLGGVHAAAERHRVRAHPPRHHDLFQRRVAGALADPVDRALDLTGARFDGGEGVGHGQAQIVVAVGAEHGPLAAGHALPHRAEHRRVFGGRGVAHGVGEVDRGGARVEGGADHAAEKVEVAARGVFGGDLDVVGVAPGALHRPARPLETLLASEPQLVLEVQVGGGDEHVHPAPRRRPQRLSGAVDVPVVAAGQSGNDRAAHRLGDGSHAAEVALRRTGEPRFDHVDAEPVELAGQPQLRLRGHGIARRLLPVAERGVENDDVSSHVVPPPFT